MTPRDGEEITLALFEGLGLPLKRVPTNEREPRPDFETTDGAGQRYLVETKTRLDAESFTDDLAEGNRAESTLTLDHDDATEKIVKKAARQLHTLRSTDRDMAILCYVLAGFSPEMQAAQLRGTLWGTVRANDAFDATFQTDCYYLGHTGFLRHQDLDGVLTVDPVGGRGAFYPNHLSPRTIEDTALGRILETLGVIRTPEDAERQGVGVVVPVTAETRGDFRAKLRAVQAKTGRRLSPMRLFGFQTAVRVLRKDITALPSPVDAD